MTYSPEVTPCVTESAIESQMTEHHIPALDAVRGGAALLVVFTHMGLLPRPFGALGVAIFFVLSGFLITWLLLRENGQTGSLSLKNFYIRRTLRIFPAFYVFWIVSVTAAILRGARVLWPEAWFSFFYLGDYFAALKLTAGAGTATIMGMTWSLGVEEKFYLLWPWVFRRFRTSSIMLLRVCVGTVLAVWLYRILVCLLLTVPRDYLRYAFESRIDNIMVGALAAVAVSFGRLPKLVETSARWSLAPLAGMIVLAGSTILEGHLQPSFHYMFGMTFDSFLIVIILLQLVALCGTTAWRLLETPFFRFFGQISYSLYLYHLPVIFTVTHFLGRLRYSARLVVELSSSIAVATASYQFIEKPFLRLKRRFEQT